MMVIAADEYERLEKISHAGLPGIAEHLLALPKDDGKFERLPFATREVEFPCGCCTPWEFRNSG